MVVGAHKIMTKIYLVMVNYGEEDIFCAAFSTFEKAQADIDKVNDPQEADALGIREVELE